MKRTIIFEECECVKRMAASKKPLYVWQLLILFTPSHTCTVSFLLVSEENDSFDECGCVKRMETQDIEFLFNPYRCIAEF